MGSPRSKKERRKSKNLDGAGAERVAWERGPRVVRADDYVSDEWRGGGSMGRVLQTLIEPYAEAAEAEGQYELLFRLGAMAWNIAGLPETDAASAVSKAVQAISGKQEADTLETIILEMVGRARRARALSPANKVS